MKDIVERLRSDLVVLLTVGEGTELLREAADEIERLQLRIDRLEHALDSAKKIQDELLEMMDKKVDLAHKQGWKDGKLALMDEMAAQDKRTYNA